MPTSRWTVLLLSCLAACGEAAPLDAPAIDGASSSTVAPAGGGAGGAGGAPSPSGGGGAGGDGGAGASLPDPAELPWTDVGFGVQRKDLGGAGPHVFVAYGGYTAELADTGAWVDELARVTLRDRGVTQIYAVQGPASPSYAELEIENSALAVDLVARTEPDTTIVIAAHSSGTFVAHELIGQLAGSLDPEGITAGKITLFHLDGGGTLSAAERAHLAQARFVYAVDGPTASANASAMQSLAQPGELIELDATGSGCNPGAVWCLHDAVIIARPYDPSTFDLARDYRDFTPERPVVTAYLDQAPM